MIPPLHWKRFTIVRCICVRALVQQLNYKDMVTVGNKVCATQADVTEEMMTEWDISPVEIEIANLEDYLAQAAVLS